jgi:hypothetical protein
MQIAMKAGERQIVEAISSAVLSSENVVDLERQCVVCGWNVAIFAAVFCAPAKVLKISLDSLRIAEVALFGRIAFVQKCTSFRLHDRKQITNMYLPTCT